MRSIVLSVFAVLATWTVAPRLGAQAVLRLQGKTVEVIGLKRWTIPMIQDSLARYAPGVSLSSHACAAVLRYQLGFADASATTYIGMTPGDTTPHVVLAVVEPHDSARVRYRPVSFDTLLPRSDWLEVVAVLKKAPWAFDAAVQAYLARRRAPPGAPLEPHLRRDSASVTQVWRFLEARRSERDRRTATEVLAADPNVHNRMVAAAILANFGGSDATWHALVEALREPDGGAKRFAGVVLSSLAATEPRWVDWAAAAPAIHAVLNGTSLFLLPELLDVLPKTGLGPEWSRPFLKDGGEMVLAYLGADLAYLRQLARRFLVAASGQDFGADATAWRAWIRTL